MTGEELFARYGEDVLGPWSSQEPDVQQAWIDIAAGVEPEVLRRARQILGEPPFEQT